ncbi:MAG: phenylalanine--tRNA ligase subunit beta [Candidatus Micrarchaeota archaeon]|nr:phenylalanine--tRNA ligase subunit beta [Candidatus Micrarchaeota archaeon]
MPTVTLALEGITTRGIDKESLPKLVDRLGMSLEKIDGKEVTIEVTPDRPDLLEVNGLTRAIKLLEGKIEPKENRYTLNGAPKLKISIGKGVKDCRPFISGFTVTGADLSGGKIKELMNFQEKLHETYGRRRKKMSIGFHNLDSIEGDVVYEASKKGSMTPLGSGKSVSFDEVMKFAGEEEWDEIIRGYGKYPHVSDGKKVISIAPVLNCEETKVTEKTENLFVEVTGTSWHTVNDAASILACLFIDSGAEVLPCSLVGGKTKQTPAMEYREFRMPYPKIDRTLGYAFRADDIITLANRMGLLAARYSSRLFFMVPPYRVDVISARDIIEDIAIAYGYERINPLPIVGTSIGTPDELEEDAESVCSALLGMGFSEALNTYLTSEAQCFDMVRREYDKESVVRVAYAKTESLSILRESIMPSLLSNLSASLQASLPQRLFEVGSVFRVEKGEVLEGRNVAMVNEHSRSNFSEIKGTVAELLKVLGISKFGLKEAKDPAFIEGRCASITVNGKTAGIFGEIHPEVLLNFGLEEPVAAAELNLEAIFGQSSK